MQNLDVIDNPEDQKRKGLEESITNGKRNKNMDIQEKVNNWLRNEDSVKVVQEFEEIIRNKKSDIIWLAYHQGQIFRKKKKKKINSFAWF